MSFDPPIEPAPQPQSTPEMSLPPAVSQKPYEPPPSAGPLLPHATESVARPAFNPLILIGGVLVAVSMFLEWGSVVLFGESFSANDIPVQFLWDTTPADFE